MKRPEIKIANRIIGDNTPVFVIAELSANHNHDFDLAVKSIHAVKECGADAIKLQTYTPDTITIDCDNEYFQIKQGTIWDGTTLYKLYQSAYTPWEWQPKLKKIAEELGLICFSSPFDKSAVDFLEEIDMPAYKIASFEIVDLPLIEYVASKGKPVIISTGIATENEIKEAVEVCRNRNNNQLALLKCTSEYPAPLEDINLKTIPLLYEKFGTVVGLSDHTLGTLISSAAVAVGARIIEKHFILDKNIESPDSKFSLNPAEFKEMVSAIRMTETALGKETFDLSKKVLKSKEHSRSIFAVKEIRKGDIFTEENVRSIRPGFGIPPKYLNQLIGKTAKRNIEKGTPIIIDDL